MTLTYLGPHIAEGGLTVPLGQGQGEPLDPLLAEATVLLRASSLDPGTYTPGQDWPNEGTAGSGYDAVATGTPEFDDDDWGLVLGGVEGVGPYFQVPYGPAVEPGTGPFTAFVQIDWTHETGGFDNICAKINTEGGALGAGGRGWQLAAGSGLGGGAAAIMANGGSSFGTDPIAAVDPSNSFPQGEHLVAMRVGRALDELTLFVDGVDVITIDASTVPDVTAVHDWIMGRGSAVTFRSLAFWDRALTDTEITVGLPAALGV